MNKRKWLGLLKMLAPIIVTTINPKLGPIAGNIVEGIEEAEHIGGASGKDKLQHVQNIGKILANQVNTAQGKEVINEDELDSAIEEVASTVVSVVNLVTKKSEQNESSK